MKKYFIIIFLLTLSVSCIKDLTFEDLSRRDRIAMTGILSTLDTVHHVIIGMSTQKLLKTLPEKAHIECYVNGVFVAKEDSIIPARFFYKEEILHNYYFKAKFSPGDRIIIKAICRDMTAEAEMVAAMPAEISIDTVSVPFKLNYNGKNVVWRNYDITMNIKDIPGNETFFRACDILMQACLKKEDKIVYVKPEKILVELDAKDPIFRLNSVDFPPQLQGSTGLSLSFKNVAFIFDDKSFTNGSYKLRYSSNALKLFGINVARKYDQKVYTTGFCRIATLPKDTYDYLYTFNLEFSSAGYPFAEPIVMKQNVKGGVGFVGIATVTEQKIDFAPMAYPDGNNVDHP